MLLDLLTILNTTPDTTRVLTVVVPGVDLTGDTKWDQFTVTDSGASAKGTANLLIEKDPSLLPEILDQSLLRVYDHSASGGEVFRGFIRGRVPSKDPAHPSLSLIADDLTSLLDDAVIDVEYRPPETMQARIGYLWGKYAGQYLSGDLSYVLSVGSTLPAQRFELVSLRNGIEMTLAQASSSAEYYVDMLGKLHVFTSETNNAPFNVDADAPGGGEIAPEHLSLEYDSGAYANRVLVKGANPVATLYVQDDAAIATANGLVRTSVLQEPSVTTAAMATSLGQMYLGRVKTAKPRGVFVTSSPDDGWRAGQNVLVTSAAHALSAQSYKIARVTTRVLVPGASMKRQYSVEFGGARSGSGLNGQTPLIAGQTAGIFMLDQLGNSIVSTAASAESGGLGPAVRRYIMSGVYNGDFYAPPPGPDAPVSDTTNPLPYWSFVQIGSAITATAFLNNAAASGRYLRFAIGAGAGTDDGYIEQIIPVNGSQNRSFTYKPYGYFSTAAGSSLAFYVYLEWQYLKSDGITTTGVLNGLTSDWTTVPIDLFIVNAVGLVVPVDAYFARLRVGVRRGGAANGDTGTVYLHEVRVTSGATDTLLTDKTDPATYGYGQIDAASGAIRLRAMQGGAGTPIVDMTPGSAKVKLTPQGALARRTTTQSINDVTWTGVSMNASEDFDPFGFHSLATNPSRFTVPTGWAGTYLLVGHSGFPANASGVNSIGWGLNGADPTTGERVNHNTTAAVGMHVTAIKELAAGDYVELMVFQNSGGALNTLGDDYGSIMYLGEQV